jgi:hypothetical protein
VRWPAVGLLLGLDACSLLFDPSSLEGPGTFVDAGSPLDGAAPETEPPDVGPSTDCDAATICERFEWGVLSESAAAGWQQNAAGATLTVAGGVDGSKSLGVTAAPRPAQGRSATLYKEVAISVGWRCELDLFVDEPRPPTDAGSPEDRALFLGVDAVRGGSDSGIDEHSFALGFTAAGVTLSEYYAPSSDGLKLTDDTAAVVGGQWLHVVAGAELRGAQRRMYVSHGGETRERALSFGPFGQGSRPPRVEVGLVFEASKASNRTLGYRIDNLICVIE